MSDFYRGFIGTVFRRIAARDAKETAAAIIDILTGLPQVTRNGTLFNPSHGKECLSPLGTQTSNAFVARRVEAWARPDERETLSQRAPLPNTTWQKQL